MSIGDWVRRPGKRQKWHLVESVVAGDAVTRCGRRMDRVTRSGGELQLSAVMPLTRMIGQPQLCKAGCERAEREDAEDTAAPVEAIARHSSTPSSEFVTLDEATAGLLRAEDDASTHDETVP